ncbi:MAG: hypothetical protein ISR65_17505 [Bacteriovoracaceae bacterium]|nr:hypothetical protein [Bacteriovoracaceae bacterium]
MKREIEVQKTERFLVLNLLLFILLVPLLANCSTNNKVVKAEVNKIEMPQDIYREAQMEFHRKNYKRSLILFKQFIEVSKSSNEKEKLFWCVDQVGRIYLKTKKNPSEAIKFFKHVLTIVKFDKDHEDTIREWIVVAKEWKKFGRMPKNAKDPSELYFLGEKYYQKGMDKIQFPADDTGNADFYIAATYLVPYVYNYDSGKHIGKALFMLGNIRSRSWNDHDYWSENFYLKEVIRRFPHSKLSMKAYEVLEDSIRSGYTGSRGDSTPPALVKMLKQLKLIAKPKTRKEDIRSSK